MNTFQSTCRTFLSLRSHYAPPAPPAPANDRPAVFITVGDMARNLVCGELTLHITSDAVPPVEGLCVSLPRQAAVGSAQYAFGEASPSNCDNILEDALQGFYRAVLRRGNDGLFSRWDAVNAAVITFAEDELAPLAPRIAATLPAIFSEQFLTVTQELYLLTDELDECPDGGDTPGRRSRCARFLRLLDGLQSSCLYEDTRRPSCPPFHAPGSYPAPVRVGPPFEALWFLGARRIDGKPVGISEAIRLVPLLTGLTFSGLNRSALTAAGERQGAVCATAGLLSLEWPEAYTWQRGFTLFASGLLNQQGDDAPVLPDFLVPGGNEARRLAESLFTGGRGDLSLLPELAPLLSGCAPLHTEPSVLEAASRSTLAEAETLTFDNVLSSLFVSSYGDAVLSGLRQAAVAKARTRLYACMETEDAAAAYGCLHTLLQEGRLPQTVISCTDEAARLDRAADDLAAALSEARGEDAFGLIDTTRSGFFSRLLGGGDVAPHCCDRLRQTLIEKIYLPRLQMLRYRQMAQYLRELADLCSDFSAMASDRYRLMLQFSGSIPRLTAGTEPPPFLDRDTLDAFLSSLLSELRLPRRLPAGFHRLSSEEEMLTALLAAYEPFAAGIFRHLDTLTPFEAYRRYCDSLGLDALSYTIRRLTATGDDAIPLGCCYFSGGADLVTRPVLLGNPNAPGSLLPALAEALPGCLRSPAGHDLYLRITGGFLLRQTLRMTRLSPYPEHSDTFI